MTLFRNLRLLGFSKLYKCPPLVMGGIKAFRWEKLIIMLLPAFIAACGGDSSSSSNEQNNTIPDGSGSSVAINALDSTSSIRKGTKGIIALENNVKTSDGSQAYLSAVTPLGEQVDAQCRNVNVDANNLAFTVHANHIGACTYEYQVSDIENRTTTKAISRVAVQSSTGPTAVTYTLTPIGQTVTENESIDIDLKTELGSVFPENGVLQTNVTVLGSGSATADPSTSTISYNAGSEGNVTRVLYTIIVEDNVYLGTIDIAVSTTINTAPTAGDFTYIDEQCVIDNEANETEMRCDQITDASNIVIDLADKIGDIDEGDTAQVIEVYAFDADVSLANPDDPTSTLIHFSAGLPKLYYVTYVVSDHRGGYAIGQIEINVVGAFSYVIVEETGDVFAPPFTAGQADLLGLNTFGVVIESEPTGPNGTPIPTFDWETANAICVSKGGTLPTREQLSSLVAQEGTNLYTNTGWPSSKPYWTSELIPDSINAFAYDPISSESFGNAQFIESPAMEGAYVTCIDRTPSHLNIINIGVLPHNVPMIFKANYVTASGITFPYEKPLLWSVSDETIASIDLNTNAITGLIVDELVDITASSYDGQLSDTVTVKVIKDLLVLNGAHGTFEWFEPRNPPATDSCETFYYNYDGKLLFRDSFPDDWTLEAATYGEEIRVHANCKDLTPDYSNVFIELYGAKSTNFITLVSPPFPFTAGTDLAIEFDSKLVDPRGTTMGALIRCEGLNKVSSQLIFDNVEYFTNIKPGYEPLVEGEMVTESSEDRLDDGWHRLILPLNGSLLEDEGVETNECRIEFNLSAPSPAYDGSSWYIDNVSVYPIARP